MDKRTRLKYIMPMTGNSTSKNKVLASENIINNNIFNLNNNYDISVNVNNNWETESKSRSLRRWLHTHIFLSDFTRAYSETKDEKYFTESFKLLNDWFETFPVEKIDSIDPLAYHDEGTAIRLLFWFKYYNQFIELFQPEQLSLFESKIEETVTLLNSDEFYAGLNNHGMFQDMSLLAYSFYKYEDFSESDIFNKALERIYIYFREVFTSEGVHKEHAPSYHVLLLHSLKQILTSLNLADYSDFRTDSLKDIFGKGEIYTINITMPDFKLPNISDSTHSTQINMSTSGVYRNLFNSEEYKFITSGGKEGKQPLPLMKNFPESGYLIARDGWKKTSTYFLFLASYHMHYHKHTDDLSFILYKNGPIFIDSGPHNYNYKEPFTEYAYSQFAHSTLIVNNNSLPRTDYKFKDVYISDSQVDTANNTFSVEGTNKRYKNTKHIRRISGDMDNGNFKITDKILSSDFNQYKVIFQINGDLDVLLNGNIVSIFKNNAKVAELEVSHHSGISEIKVYNITGQRHPKIMGYQFPEIEEPMPSNTLVIECYNDGTESVIDTEIRLSEFKITGNANFSKKNEIQSFRDISYVYEDYNNEKLAVVFSGTEDQYNYRLDEYNQLKDKGFNILYLYDNHAVAGRSFIQGASSSTIESDTLTVINKIMNEYHFTNELVHVFARSKGAFAALYYSLTSGFNNIYVSTPIVLIGDYYERHEKLKPMINTLGFQHKDSMRYYLNDYLSNINHFSKVENLNICVGENDYHRTKHIDYLTKWLEEKNIKYSLTIYPNAEFSDDKEEFIKFIENYNFK
ncbi:accessory Sec system protein Asp2 [Salinicoccus sp. YB14-2]|uniref:heparinase II/III domain-containing protein n=1 Tax=Salinicoccus sp. YB14-2 TaxID=1572701 RepID=UPI00068A0483|nr:accessory Sec system protein Asp2 [Salinicoccus sp. YB14-2]